MTKYPRVGKGKDMQEPGKDIWDAFRPCYIRAFKDAADFKADDGRISSFALEIPSRFGAVL
jgi:hypothetical protein